MVTDKVKEAIGKDVFLRQAIGNKVRKSERTILNWSKSTNPKVYKNLEMDIVVQILCKELKLKKSEVIAPDL